MSKEEELERENIRLKKELEEALHQITIMTPAYVKEQLRQEDKDKRSTGHYQEFPTKIICTDPFNKFNSSYDQPNPFWGANYKKIS